jgi:hypothetical protein
LGLLKFRLVSTYQAAFSRARSSQYERMLSTFAPRLGI